MKKKLALICIILCLQKVVEAKNFYLSSAGNDGNTGTSANAAWQTIGKLNKNFLNIFPGDSILFRCGDVFYGAIEMPKSGTAGRPIAIAAFGKGAKPIISGYTQLNNWVEVEKGIWQCAAPLVKATVNLLTINNLPQQIGRYPDVDEKGGGYLKYESFVGNNVITDDQLNPSINWAGAEICLKKEGYLLERNIITSLQGHSIYYLPLPSINPRNGEAAAAIPAQAGFGYFIQRHKKTLTKFGEWYFDKETKMMYVFADNKNLAGFSIKVSSVDTLININNHQYISISNIALQGANLAAIYAADASNISIKNCSIKNSGAKGIFIWNSPDIFIDNCTITYAACNAIDVTGRYAANATITNCTVSNTATMAGMGSFYDPADMKAIYVSVSSHALIEYNKIDTVGYIGIQFQGDSVRVQNNYINYHNFIVDDGGGIYTYATRNIGRVIQNNIIINGIGCTKGNAFEIHAEGIYTDGGARGIYIYNNTIAYCANRGIYMNDPKIISVYNNTCYSNGIGWGVNKHAKDSIFNLMVLSNIFYSTTGKQANFTYANSGLNEYSLPAADNIQEALQLLGSIDSNYYNTPMENGWSWYYAAEEGGRYTFENGVNFETWKTYTGLDANSTRPARIATHIGESKLLYNATDKKTTFYLDKKYVGVDGKIFTDSVVLNPFCSIILILANAPMAGKMVATKNNSIPYKNIAAIVVAIGTGAFIFYYIAKKKQAKAKRNKNKIRVRVRRY